MAWPLLGFRPTPTTVPDAAANLADVISDETNADAEAIPSPTPNILLSRTPVAVLDAIASIANAISADAIADTDAVPSL